MSLHHDMITLVKLHELRYKLFPRQPHLAPSDFSVSKHETIGSRKRFDPQIIKSYVEPVPILRSSLNNTTQRFQKR